MELRTEPTEILSGGTPTDDASTDTVVEGFVENAQRAPEAGAGAHAAEAYTEQAQKAAATVSGQAARLTDICEAPGPAPAGGPG